MSNTVTEQNEYDFFGPYSITSYENGFDVILKPVDRADTVTSQLWFQAGSVYESDDNNGLSHYLEHMLFKGTDEFERDRINEMIDEVGGRQNAGTSKDYTNYYATLPKTSWERGPRLLEQMGYHALLPEDEFQKERQVVLSELDRYEDDPRKKLWKEFIPMLYEGHPYERLTIGQRDVIEDVTIEQLRDYYKQFYVTNRSGLVVAGGFEPDRARDMVEDLFLDEPAGEQAVHSFSDPVPPESESIRRIQEDVGQVYGMLGTIGYPASDRKSIALDVLMKVYGGSNTSRLYENLVLKEQLASQVSSSFWTQQEPGPVYVQFQTSPDRTDDLLEGIRRETSRIAEDGITREEFDRAKTQIKTQFIYSSQTPSGQANQLGYWHTIDSVEYLNDYIDKIDSITRSDITSVAEEVLADRNWAGVLLTPED
ncbi:MAG: M16 family metallopeptidase [bacterium]